MKNELKNESGKGNRIDEIKLEGILSKGYGIIPKLVAQDTKLTAEAKAIYSYLCSYAGAGQTAFPSVSLMVHHLDMSENRFYKHRKYLVDRGYVSIERVRTDNGFSKNIYTLNQSVPLQNEGIGNEGKQNEDIRNKGTNNNSIKINNINKNNINKTDDDEDINKQIEKIVTQKIKKNLSNAGIENLTTTKLRPIAISMSKLMNLHNKNLEEAEEIILLAIESFELNNGQSLNYLIALLEDWEEKELYSAEDIRKDRRDYKRGYTHETEYEIEPVPMINWLKDLQK